MSPDEIFDSHTRATLRRVRQNKVVLFVQDTTEIDLTRPASTVEGTGPLNAETQLGALYHPMIAYDTSGLPLGTIWNRRWVREGIHPGEAEEKHQARKYLPIEKKESYRWLEGLREARGFAEQAPETTCICMADSEADIYELFAEPRDTKSSYVHLLIRGCYGRAIRHDKDDREHGTILRAIRSKPIIAEHTIDVSQRKPKELFSKTKRKCPAMLAPQPYWSVQQQ